MVEQEIIDLTQIAKSYLIELGSEMIDEQKKGCDDCADKISWKIQQIIMLVESLYEKVRINDYGEQTDSLYSCLLGAVGSYSGASLSLDPNSVNPNIVIDVTIIGNDLPNWIDVFWADMTNDVSGYRDTYFNGDWVGLNPMIQIEGVVMYQVDVDYTNDGQGTITFKAGKGLYDGQYFRAGNYQVYTAPPIDIFTYKLVNNSEVDTEYTLESVVTPLVVGQTIENPIIIGQAIGAQVMDGQTCTYTIYDSEGEVVYTVTIIGEAFINGNSMVANQNQEFIYINSTAIAPNPPTNGIVDNNNDTFTFTGGTI